MRGAGAGCGRCGSCGSHSCTCLQLLLLHRGTGAGQTSSRRSGGTTLQQAAAALRRRGTGGAVRGVAWRGVAPITLPCVPRTALSHLLRDDLLLVW